MAVDIAIGVVDFFELFEYLFEVVMQGAYLFVVEGFVVVDEVLGVLDAFLETRDQFFARGVVEEVLQPVDEVRVLREVQILSRFAQLAHPASGTGVHCADEGEHLFVFAADHLLDHVI